MDGRIGDRMSNESSAPNSCNSSRRRALGKATGLAALSLLGAAESRADLDIFHLRSHLQRRKSHLTPLKTRAMQDYRASMSSFGGSLANPPEQLQQASQQGGVLDVLIVGSGYGGAINAARLAQRMRPGGQLAVLERGQEWVPGTFPDSLNRWLDQSRRGLFGPARKRLKNRLGLVDLSFHDEFYVLAGSGLGGGSLINAGVAVTPDPDVFRQDCWPAALRDIGVLAPYYDRVAHELNLQVIDCDTQKTRALQYVARRDPEGRAITNPAMVTATHRGRGLDSLGRNRQGVIQRPCTLCGDCSTGCNVGAKNTLPMTYLPMAKQFGAQLYTQTEVESIAKEEGLYRVHFKQFRETSTGMRSYSGCVRARIVILSAGSLGSTGILLRSQSPSLSFSHRLGDRWSGNGDVYGFMVRGDVKTNIGGVGAYDADAKIGVTQQMHLYLQHEQLGRRMLLQEGAVPRAYTNALGGLVGDLDLDRALAFFALGHDGANGRVTLRDGKPTISWPSHFGSGYIQFAHAQLRRLAKAGNGKYRKPNALGKKSFTVHPLGGCAMADSVNSGVATDWGQVYSGCGAGGTEAVHHGLYVADGSLIPTSLAANPFLTIAALSERIAERICADPDFADLFSARTS